MRKVKIDDVFFKVYLGKRFFLLGFVRVGFNILVISPVFQDEL